ncbi:MAG: YciI family protein [Anaeromyxobacteraceae bacterium]
MRSAWPVVPIAVLLTALLASPVPSLAAEEAKPAEAKAAEPAKAKFEFETVQLVLLMRAPTWKKLPDDEAQALQKAHIGHLEAMGAAGKMVVAGPFGDQTNPDYRGICVYRVGSVAEAKALAEQDPAVRAGQMRVEAMTWYFGKGYMTFPKTVPPAGPAR